MFVPVKLRADMWHLSHLCLELRSKIKVNPLFQVVHLFAELKKLMPSIMETSYAPPGSNNAWRQSSPASRSSPSAELMVWSWLWIWTPLCWIANWHDGTWRNNFAVKYFCLISIITWFGLSNCLDNRMPMSSSHLKHMLLNSFRLSIPSYPPFPLYAPFPLFLSLLDICLVFC